MVSEAEILVERIVEKRKPMADKVDRREFMFVFEDLLPIEGWRVFKLLDRYSPVSMDGGRLRRWVVVEKICLE